MCLNLLVTLWITFSHIPCHKCRHILVRLLSTFMLMTLSKQRSAIMTALSKFLSSLLCYHVLYTQPTSSWYMDHFNAPVHLTHVHYCCCCYYSCDWLYFFDFPFYVFLSPKNIPLEYLWIEINYIFFGTNVPLEFEPRCTLQLLANHYDMSLFMNDSSS